MVLAEHSLPVFARRGRGRLGQVGVRRVLFVMVCLVVALMPTAARAWWNGDWSYRKKITLDTGPKGAALAQDPGRMPVLIRLHDGNFKFELAKEDGSDLRFVADDDKTPLKFHIEKFDAVFGLAFVWVDVPALKAGTPTTIWMYYGNQKASPAGDARGTYDGDQTLVYHFGEKDGPPRDQTGYKNDAQTPAKPVDGSLIGGGIRLDGSAPIVLPASPSLAVTEGGALSWSAWIKPDTAQETGVIFARRAADKALVIGLDQGAPYVLVTDGAATARSGPVDALPAGAWHQITITAADQITLYVDGQARATVAAHLPALTGTSSLGGDVAPASSAAPATMPPPPAAAPDNAAAPPAAASSAVPPGSATPTGAAPPASAPAAPPFLGEMDELEIAKVARGAGFIAAMTASQGPDGKLVVYGEDEQTSSWNFGYFGVILKSVTVDGWVVISILVLMAILSWFVMVNKAITVGRTARANEVFITAFRTLGRDLAALDGEGAGQSALAAGLTDKERTILDSSSLFHIYRLGIQELQRRFADDAGENGGAYRVLSPQSIEAIRATLDSGIVRETQRLNRLMVLLTIAISGGPFLGLLGTVVGVMITFAAIAATGDVNVNAIAPGIAAALVATVAGLGVAIPALFGYNYLITRIKDTTADMNVFVDEFVTRLAEFYCARLVPREIAAE